MSVTDPFVMLCVGILGVVLYQIFVTVRLIKFTGYSGGQKIAQLFLIWFLPLLGTWVVHAVIRSTEATIVPADRDFTPQDPQNVA
jgi:hypothetical protein